MAKKILKRIGFLRRSAIFLLSYYVLPRNASIRLLSNWSDGLLHRLLETMESIKYLQCSVLSRQPCTQKPLLYCRDIYISFFVCFLIVSRGGGRSWQCKETLQFIFVNVLKLICITSGINKLNNNEQFIFIFSLHSPSYISFMMYEIMLISNNNLVHR